MRSFKSSYIGELLIRRGLAFLLNGFLFDFSSFFMYVIMVVVVFRAMIMIAGIGASMFVVLLQT